MLPVAYRISRVQETLRRFEQDIPLLNMRVKDLSAERQRSARQFAAALIDQTRTELQRLLQESIGADST
jgi:primosomal protein N''